MNKFKIIAFVAVLLGSCSDQNISGLQPPPEMEIFPLAVGNEWVYRYYNDTTTFSWKVVGTELKNGNTYFILEEKHRGSFRDSMYLRNDEHGRVQRNIDGKEYLWFDFTKADSETYSWHIDEELPEYVVTVRNHRTIETFAQTFSDCFDFYFDLPGAIDDEFGYTVAPGYGVIVHHGAWIYAKLEKMILR